MRVSRTYPILQKSLDTTDEELDEILKDYFQKKKINDFEIEDITLQIKGKFNN